MIKNVIFQADNLNNVAWNDIQNNVLKVATTKTQEVTASWTMESLVTESTTVMNPDSTLSPDGNINNVLVCSGNVRNNKMVSVNCR